MYKYEGHRKNQNGIEWYLESYNKLIAEGTSQTTCYFTIQYRWTLPKGTYTVTGCPRVEGCDLRIIDLQAHLIVAKDIGYGETFTTNEDKVVQVVFVVAQGVTLDSVVFAPNITSFYKRYPIPIDIQNKEGYGTDDGYIDFDRKKWVYGDSEEDISHILTDYLDYKFIEVEGGGELIAENKDKNPVPWTVTFAEV